MSKDKKTLQLGMNPSTAQHALRKELMFHLAKHCNMDICFQCGSTIETSKELSIEHKVPWLDSEDPIGLFFDLDNIAFSHLKCNIAAARHPEKGIVNHGTTSGYDHFNCRCVLCKAAKAERNKTTWNTPEKRKDRYQRTGQ